MIVTSNRSLFNNLAKILCRYDSNEREKPSSTNLAELFIYAVPFQFLTACLVFSTGERGAVVLHGFFWILELQFTHKFHVARKTEKVKSSSQRQHFMLETLISQGLPLALSAALDYATAKQQLEDDERAVKVSHHR